MADRIITWYVDGVTGDGTSQGSTFCLDQSYALPATVRLSATHAPDIGDLKVDIKADGVSIFGTHKISAIGKTTSGTYAKWDVTDSSFYAVLPKGSNQEEHAGSFSNDKTRLAQYSWLTMDLVQSGGAKRITVQLELNHEYKEEEPDEED